MLCMTAGAGRMVSVGCRGRMQPATAARRIVAASSAHSQARSPWGWSWPTLLQSTCSHTRCLSARASSAAPPPAPAAAQPSPPAATTPTAHLMLHNTMTRSKERFEPRAASPTHVSLYVCGVTVYDLSHIGHARVYVAFDLLVRTLTRLGYTVDYVRNFTDIDDKIIARAQVTGEDPLALSARFIDEFHTDIDSLGCARPTREPKASDHVADMVATIETIIENGHAYAVDGDVFFDVRSIEGYGRLSGQTLDGGVAGGSKRVAVDARKKDPADFALWKQAKPGEPTWDSPWGPGRPGWHIECSSMIRTLMGPVIDIHGGGRDLVFPHHENEIAQSHAAARCSCDADHLVDGKDFVRYWVHNGFVNVDSEKMSKSMGNFFTIRQVLKQYHPLAVRWFLLTAQYRQPINYTRGALEDASARLYYIVETLISTRPVLVESGAPTVELELDPSKLLAQASTSGAGEGSLCDEAAGVWARVNGALLDDLNTPVAIAALSEPLKIVNDLLFTKKGKKAKDRLQQLASHEAIISNTLSLMGLDVTDPQGLADELRALTLVRAELTESAISAAISERAEARKNKDFERSDALRLEFEGRGIGFQDTPTGTTWRPMVRPQ